MMTFEEFVKLILRTGPYVLSNPEISNCPIPEDMHLFPNGKKKQNKEGFQFYGLGMKTLGDLVRLWENMEYKPCKHCQGRTALVGCGGSMLSGIGKFSYWYCPSCNTTFRDVPDCSVIYIVTQVRSLKEKDLFIVPQVNAESFSLNNIQNVFNGKLLNTYIALALEKLVELDEMSAKAIAINEQFPSTFHIRAGDNVGTLLFKKKMWLSNEGGFAEVYGKKRSPMHKKEFGPNPNNLHEEKLLFKIRTAYDPIYGLWGVLYEAKDLLETYYNSNTSVGC